MLYKFSTWDVKKANGFLLSGKNIFSKEVNHMAVKDKVERSRALTNEGRENQLISYAMNLAAEQLLNGTASSQMITHFLKAGAMKTQLEIQKLAAENRLLDAKVEQLASAQRTEELYEEAIRAMRKYSGHEEEIFDEDIS